MFYFNDRGGSHSFPLSFNHLEYVSHYFVNKFYEDLLSCDSLVDVYYTMDPYDNITSIQLVLRFDSYSDLNFLIHIDVHDFDNGDVYWRSYFYRFAIDSNQDFVFRFLLAKDFIVSDFPEVDYFFRNDLFISKNYIKKCLDRPFPLRYNELMSMGRCSCSYA